MRKGLIEVGIIVFGLLGNIAAVTAQVDHVSINSRQFELNKVARLRVNMVAQNDDVSRLSFYIRQLDDGNVQQQKLTVQGINHFLFQLSGTDVVSDPNAQLMITQDTAAGVATLAIMAVFDAPYSVNSATLVSNFDNQQTSPVATPPVMRASKTRQVDNRLAQEPSLPAPSSVKSAQQVRCLIERDNSDTLWRIANRYKEQWHTSVYGAMLAIFETNLLAFSKQKIHLLVKDVPLNCPSTAILAEYNNKAFDKKVFEMIEAKHGEK
ncbi:FimV/HubP family polar landmark protein [Shewanella sp. S1-49-MNA-CIBAN-0167]|uniref:FimV/HubP family polar landmark protein n=1 Tax=Shewanella sp. S1-49-MNA-CIBAN-0167 TaxID=3140468 RepID=UPI00331EABAE